MKKFLFTALLMLVIAGCADDNSTDDNSTDDNSTNDGITITTPPTDEVVVISNEAELGKTANLSVTLKNPHNIKAQVYINFNLTDSLKLQIKDTNCGTFSDYNIEGTLEAGQECTINYTFKPTDLSTEMILLNVDYQKDRRALCNNLTLDNIKTNNIYNRVKVINYAKHTNGTKSPDVEKIAFKPDYALLGKENTYITTQTFSFDKGTYHIDAFDLTVKALDSNCQISGSTLEVLNSNACKLEFTYKTNIPYDTYAKFNSSTKNYTIDITFTTQWYYDMLSPSSSFNIQYINGIPSNEIQTVDITALMDYKLQGTDAAKFQVKPAPFDGCTITSTNINLPQGKTKCYFMIDLTDTVKQTDGNYTAQISSTTTGVTLNIEGISMINPLEYFKNNMCYAKP